LVRGLGVDDGWIDEVLVWFVLGSCDLPDGGQEDPKLASLILSCGVFISPHSFCWAIPNSTDYYHTTAIPARETDREHRERHTHTREGRVARPGGGVGGLGE
jgi:hypothetical protein